MCKVEFQISVRIFCISGHLWPHFFIFLFSVSQQRCFFLFCKLFFSLEYLWCPLSPPPAKFDTKMPKISLTDIYPPQDSCWMKSPSFLQNSRLYQPNFSQQLFLFNYRKPYFKEILWFAGLYFLSEFDRLLCRPIGGKMGFSFQISAHSIASVSASGFFYHQASVSQIYMTCDLAFWHMFSTFYLVIMSASADADCVKRFCKWLFIALGFCFTMAFSCWAGSSVFVLVCLPLCWTTFWLLNY